MTPSRKVQDELVILCGGGIHEVFGKGGESNFIDGGSEEEEINEAEEEIEEGFGSAVKSHEKEAEESPVQVIGKVDDENKNKTMKVETMKVEAEAAESVMQFEAGTAESDDKNEVKMKIEKFQTEPDDVAQSSLPEVIETFEELKNSKKSLMKKSCLANSCNCCTTVVQ